MFNYRTVVLSLAAAAIAATGIGVSGSQAAPSVQPDTSCTSSTSCVTDTNGGSGPGLASRSVGGTGVTGSSNLASTSTKSAAGVLGTDASATGTFNAGVKGTSVRGTGVFGTSKTGTGVSGTSTGGGTGVVGSSSGTGVGGFGSTVGVEGQGPTGVEALGSGTNSTAVLAYANGSGGTGVSANGDVIGLQAFAGNSSGVAVQANSNGGNLFTGLTGGGQVFAVDGGGNLSTSGQISANGAFISVSSNIAIEGEGPSTGILGLQTTSSLNGGAVMGYGGGGDIFDGLNNVRNKVFYVDNNGNIGMIGHVAMSGPCAAGCVSTNLSATRVVSYAPRESQPSMEDFGEAQLVGGQAYVRLDPAFANVIDGRSTYLVFITPEGDSHGLYVSEKSPSGFAVHENEGGRASVSFSYRIVAKPYGDASPRLPMTTMRRLALPAHIRHTSVLPIRTKGS